VEPSADGYAASVRVLVVEDNRRLAATLTRGLREMGWSVVAAHDGPRGLAWAREGLKGQPFDVIVLDWMLPELDGVEVLHRLRGDGDGTPALMLTARDGVGDRVRGLETGADDYLVKPFAFEELVARIRALVRRTRGGNADVVRVADLEVDTRGRVVRRAGQPLDLSAREYEVLEILALNRGRVVSREQILSHVYEGPAEAGSNVVDVFVGHLRRKIDRDRAVKLIHTRRGQGYVLEAKS